MIKNGWELIYAKSSIAVEIGDVARSFRGDEYVITGGDPPKSINSSGRVLCRQVGGGPGSEFYPNVFNMKWVALDEHAQGRQSHDPD